MEIVIFLIVIGVFVYINKTGDGNVERNTTWDYLGDPLDLRNKKSSDD